jgi:hypothetical protein
MGTRSSLVRVLVGIAVGVVAAAGASRASEPEVHLAAALEIPVASVLEAVEIEVDRAVVGVFGRYEHDGAHVAVLVRQPGEPAIRLGRADDVWFAGIVDLRADTRLTQQRRTPRRLSTAGLGRPALVLLTRHEEKVAPGPKTPSAGSRGPGIRRETHLFLVELARAARVLLDLEIEHRSEDGFGGHDLGGLALRHQDGTTYLEGVRQDRLPASRARCLKPEPYAVRFELAGSWFRELPVERRQIPCG